MKTIPRFIVVLLLLWQSAIGQNHPIYVAESPELVVQAYPNPVSAGALTIGMNQELKQGEISFFNLNGQGLGVVKAIPGNELMLETTPGMIFYRFSSGEMEKTGKVMLNSHQLLVTVRLNPDLKVDPSDLPRPTLSTAPNICPNPDFELVTTGSTLMEWNYGGTAGGSIWRAPGGTNGSWYGRLKISNVNSGAAYFRSGFISLTKTEGSRLFLNAFTRSNMKQVRLQINQFDQNKSFLKSTSSSPVNPTGWAFVKAKINGDLPIDLHKDTRYIRVFIIAKCDADVHNYLDVDQVSCFVSDPQEVQFLGEMDRFYGNTQLQGNLVQDGLWMDPVPVNWTYSHLELPYLIRPQAEEVYFVDKFSVVRFLGGFNPSWSANVGPENDLVYEDQNGLHYRWELLRARLQPYLDQGYGLDDIMINVDNVPWALARDQNEWGTWGQSSPPRSWPEWRTFIADMCQALADTFGYANASQLRFKMGTEYNQGEGLTGDQQDYFDYYKYSAQGIQQVFPNAYIMPCEIGGDHIIGKVNMLELIDYCDAENLPMDGFARSLHCFGGNEIDPRVAVNKGVRTFNDMLDRSTNFNRDNTDLQLHQFGWLKSNIDVNGTIENVWAREPGARGASWAFMTLFGLKSAGILDQSWHWAVSDQIRYGGQGNYKQLMMGEGCMYLVLDQLVGGDLYVLDVPAETADGTFFFSIASVKEDATYIVTASLNMDRSKDNQAVWVDLSLPKFIQDFPDNPSVAYTHLFESNTAHYKVKQDLAAANNLNVEFQNNSNLGTIPQMAINNSAAFQMVWNNFGTYNGRVAQFQDLNNFDMNRYTDGTEKQDFRIWMKKTALHVLKIEH